jgi:hypothetical protein
MKRTLLSSLGPRGVALTSLVSAITAIGAEAPGPTPELARLRDHVATLAAPEFGGRRGPGGLKAAAYIVDQFRQTGLEPLFDGRYTQDVTDPAGKWVLGRNVGARLVGSDPKLRDEWIVLAAHYDHLGIQQGRLYPGADDNASGVAMLLEVARCLRLSTEPPRRSLMFLAFDLEEEGLGGSRYFVEHPPVPINQIVLNLTADMIGRSLGGVCDPHVFVLGSESAPGLRRWIDAANPGDPWKVAQLGADFLVIPRSDYGPFRARKVPFLFFSTGENPVYHRPQDVPESLNYPKLHAITGMIGEITRQAAMTDAVPRWVETPDYPSGEAETLREVLTLLLNNQEALRIGSTQMGLIRSTLGLIDEVIERGAPTVSERSRLIRAAQVILLTVL